MDYSLYEKADLADHDFPIKVFCCHSSNPGIVFNSHWHEQMEFLFITEGKATIECSSIPVSANANDLIVINSNELHSGHNNSEYLEYYCIIIDTSLLSSSFDDACEVKYITPIVQNLIKFRNKVYNDQAIMECIKNIIYEYENKELGYELSVKSLVYKLLVILLRNHLEKLLTLREYDTQVRNLERLNKVFNYIENNFTNEISVEQLSAITSISVYHFCHLFKRVTGKTLSEYVNRIRINKAEALLRSTEMNITEIALSSGFNDINYFSRLFKRYKNISPSLLRKNYNG